MRYSQLIYGLKYDEDNLVLSPKGVQAAESALLARYFMYPTVYQHHTTRIVNSMFRVSLSRLLEDKVIEEKVTTLNNIPIYQEYLRRMDEFNDVIASSKNNIEQYINDKI